MNAVAETLSSLAASPAAITGLYSMGYILGAMAVIALIETAIPLHTRTRWSRAHLAPNFTLTAITFATNLVLNIALVAALVWAENAGFGLLHGMGLAPLAALAIAVLVLDFSTYAAHVTMHEVPAFWRFHRVHHSDSAVDVTTTIRQHPGEGVIRYTFLAVFALAIGASPVAFAIYRIWSALQGLVEHANIRLPQRLDSALALVVVSPNMHKVHHARDARLTDTNFGNLTSLWDRLFFTFTPAKMGAGVDCGLDGFDAPGDQTVRGLLAMPFRERSRRRGPRNARLPVS